LHVAVCFQDAAAPAREHAGLRRVELGDEPMMAVLGADHRLAGERELELRALADDPWMAPSPDGIVVRACRAAGFEPRLIILTRDPLAVRAIAAAGLAVSLTPRLIAGIGLPGIVTPALAGDPPRRRLYALLPETGAHPQSGALVEALRSEIP
jgi:DNA-binding transcriptional LysR family regulator